MSERRQQIGIAGWGAVSSAGWGAHTLLKRVISESPPAPVESRRTSKARPYLSRPVPKPTERFPFLRNARLRRCSPATRFAVAAALEALGEQRATAVSTSDYRLGIVFVFMNGCVNYSNRFYGEVLADPALASPILFPETVFNAPASHLAALLGSELLAYTLVGDAAQFLPAVETGIQWLGAGQADGVLVVGCEELDWLSAEAAAMFSSEAIVSEGAGALLLEAGQGNEHPIIHRITDAYTFAGGQNAMEAAGAVRAALPASLGNAVHLSGARDIERLDHAENMAWNDWPGPHIAPATWLGDAMGAGHALQCVLSAALIADGRYDHVLISHSGGNQQAVGAWMGR